MIWSITATGRPEGGGVPRHAPLPATHSRQEKLDGVEGVYVSSWCSFTGRALRAPVDAMITKSFSLFGNPPFSCIPFPRRGCGACFFISFSGDVLHRGPKRAVQGGVCAAPLTLAPAPRAPRDPPFRRARCRGAAGLAGARAGFAARAGWHPRSSRQAAAAGSGCAPRSSSWSLRRRCRAAALALRV